MAAFDDRQLCKWVIRLTAERSGHFLCALSETVLKADDEDYSIIRLALVSLRRKYVAGRRSGRTNRELTGPRERKGEAS
jgi:hypothetical protein